RHSASSDTGQGGTLPRRPGVSSPPPRTAGTGAASELAGLLSPRVQPPAPARGPRHANPGQSMAQESTPIHARSAPMGLPGVCRSASSDLARRPPPARKTLANQQNSGRRAGPNRPHRSTDQHPLQAYPHPRNRPRQPGFDGRRTLAGESNTVKDVQRQNVKDVQELDTFRPLNIVSA